MEALRDRKRRLSRQTRLMEDTRLAGQPIEVTASDGYIHYSEVDSDDDKTLAEEIALGVSVSAVETD